MSEWLPIETAPKGVELLLYCDTFGVELGSYRSDDNDREGDPKWWYDNSYDDFSTGHASCPLNPTHWMPLPEPPK